MALAAALLGWMFDGLEMGLFPLVARPALGELLHEPTDSAIGKWFAVATAGFLVGAATGGVLFGWLGDRVGRVRAMTLSVLTYAFFSGLCGLSTAAWQVVVLRFVAALGMGGEWSLGVALVMEVWPNRSRALLAGLIGAVANFGYMLIALVGLGLGRVLEPLGDGLRGLGVSGPWVESLVGHSGWRLLMLLGATPAVLTFFIRLFVPESGRWEHERATGKTTAWAARDLLGVLVGTAACGVILVLWAIDPRLAVGGVDWWWAVRVAGSLAALAVVTASYLFPVVRFLQRGEGSGAWRPTVGRMLLGASLSGVALLGTWAAIQWAPTWADQLSERQAQQRAAATVVGLGAAGGGLPAGWALLAPAVVSHSRDVEAKFYTQICSAGGAVAGTILAALLGGWWGRRSSYVLLCLLSLGSALLFFGTNDHVGPYFMATVFLAGACTASFYGWLPLYLPELFRTRVRATGQGFSFNFGRILAAVGTLQTGALIKGLFHDDYARACSVMSLIYLVGLGVIWLAPETHGQPLPE
jgi:MFS family permease